MSRERVEATPRGAMTKARRLRIYLACEGRCICGVKVPMEGTTIDHPTQLWMGGPDEDQYLRYMCAACDKPKTARDAKERAKVKRLIRKADPAQRKVSRLQSRGFQKGRRPLVSRPFPKREVRP